MTTKALSLFGVLLTARVLILAGRDVPFSFWLPIACLWQDVLLVLMFAGLDRLTARRPWISRMVYCAIVLYVAINLPLFRYLSSPLTLPMFRAARSALADSIRDQLTGENLGLIGLILGAGAILPLLLRDARWRPRVSVALCAAATGLVALGPTANSQVDTAGLHRNVLVALIESAIPRMAARPTEGDWRISPFDPQRVVYPTVPLVPPGPNEYEDLSGFRAAAKGRNVILILLESTGAGYLRPYRAADDPTPNLTALADQAIRFENAYAVYPESIKGLFSVLCSRYPALDTKVAACAKVATPSIATRLAAEGYQTALFHSGRFMYLGMEEVIRHRGFQTLNDAGDIGGDHESSFGVDEPATVKGMLKWLDSLPVGGRFFLTYLPVAGHHPYEYPGAGPFPGKDDFGRYLNALHYGDAALGKLLLGLKARGLYEKTLFAIIGDHGEAFGQHEGNYGHTIFIYDENLHVPFFIAAPGWIRGPVRVGRPVSLIDTTPTILDLLGLPISNDHQGASLLGPAQRMALFYTDYSLALLGLRDGRWKFIHELGSGRSRLFDLVRDANETENLAEHQPGRVAAYREHLKRWAAAQRDLILHPQDTALVNR